MLVALRLRGLHRNWLTALSLGLLLSFAGTQAKAANVLPWKLVWSDEFNTPGRPDPLKWGFVTGGSGFGNQELENYTDRPENSYVENGSLVIEARKENFQGNKYTSARLFSKGTGWTYGRYEIRAKLPVGAGTWPAAWMLPTQQTYGTQYWPENGEIDIMEHVGRELTQIFSSFHTKNFNWMKGTQITQTVVVPTVESDFHVYRLDWDADQATISIDDKDVVTFKNPHTEWQDWPFDRNFMFILNVAIGGLGGTVDDSIFPTKMYVDYVRVYQH